MEKMQLFSSRVICAENNAESDTYRAKFVICDFSINENHVALNRNTIEEWMGTLVNKPLVGKIAAIAKGKTDFTGHNRKTVARVDKAGRVHRDVAFDTAAFGTFTDVAIETVDDTECIVAACEIWKRFENACSLIMDRVEKGTLHTSWEISVVKSHMDTSGKEQVKIIDDGIFTAHCLLGEAVSPAYESSRLLEVAEVEPCFEDRLAEALERDMGTLADITKDKEDAPLKREEMDKPCETVQTAETGTENSVEKDASEAAQSADNAAAEQERCSGKENQADEQNAAAVNGSEAASLTAHDISDRLGKAVRAVLDDGYVAFYFPEERVIWAKQYRSDELEYVRFEYTVAGDTVTLSDGQKVKLEARVQDVNTRLQALNDTIVAANETIRQKEKEIAELRVYKDRFEAAEQERLAAERNEKQEKLRQYAIASGLIEVAEVAEGGALATLILENDETGIKSVIADRFVESMKKTGARKSVEPIQAERQKPEVKAGLNNVPYDDADVKSIMNRYLHKK